MPISEANFYGMGIGGDTDTKTVKPSTKNYIYGGTGEGEFDKQAQAALARQAPVTNYANADASRANVNQGLNMAQAAAMGQTPSLAQQQLYAGRDASIQGGAQMAANARPGQGMAAQLGGLNAQYGQYNALNGQQAMARGNEINDARNAYAQGAFGLRGQDTQQAQYLAQMQAAQNAANNKYALGLQTMGQGASVAQQKANEAYIQQLAANQHAQYNTNQDIRFTAAKEAQDEKDHQAGIVSSIYGGASGLLGSLL